MTFGLYVPRSSPVHALSAKVKLLILAIAGIVTVLIANPLWLTGLLAGVNGGLLLARLPLRAVWHHLHPMLPLLVAILLLQGLFGDWQAGGVAVLRFLILVELATLVTLTTRISDMVEAIERGLQPFARFGFRPAQVSLMIAMALHLIPVLLNQFQQIQEAQRARGLDRHPIALIVPLFIKTLRMADDLSDALDVRCYAEDTN